jgi:TorA maturation chaperone TorD
MGAVSKKDTGEYISREERRGACFRLLAACFYPPERGLFIQEDLLEDLTDSLDWVCPEAAQSCARMKEAFRRSGKEDLSVEYARLFIGPFELAAPPYASVYLDKGKRIMGDSTLDVVKIYQEQGLRIDDEFKELPDHIAVELEFMYYLTHNEVEALRNGDPHKAAQFRESQEFFLNAFVIRWVPRFCEKLRSGTENGFYRALADCLLAFVRQTNGLDPGGLNRTETA